MKKNNFKTVSKQINETKKGVVKGNTVILNFGYELDQPPQYVGFSIVRGEENQQNYNGNPAISGSLGSGGNFNTQMHEPRQRGDGALIDEVWEICNELLNPTTNGTGS